VRNRSALTLIWATVWVCSSWAGVSFETFDLAMWHIADPQLLREEPLRTLFYLHAQPPLLNALAAGALLFFGEAHAIALYAVFAAMALATVLIADELTHTLTRSRWAGLAAGALVALSPSLIVYGHVFYHALPSALITLCIPLSAHRAVHGNRIIGCLAFGGSVAAAALLWSAFHPVWVLVVVCWFLWCHPKLSKAAIAGALIPLVLVGALVVKNGLVFGFWGTSSWTGMNFARATTFQIPNSDREEMIANGSLSEVSRVRPFASLAHYRFVPDPEPTGILLLDQRERAGGKPNLHHLKYLEVSRWYGDDARTVLREHPGHYAAAVARTFWLLYLHPATDFHVVEPQREALGRYADLYEGILYGRPPGGERPHVGPNAQWNLLGSARSGGVVLKLWFVTLLLVSPLWILVFIRRKQAKTPDGVAATALVGMILYVTLVCSLFEMGENQRFRFAVEPAAIALTFILAAAFWKGRRGGSRSASAAGKPEKVRVAAPS
jgi:hypothetical protein